MVNHDLKVGMIIKDDVDDYLYLTEIGDDVMFFFYRDNLEELKENIVYYKEYGCTPDDTAIEDYNLAQFLDQSYVIIDEGAITNWRQEL